MRIQNRIVPQSFSYQEFREILLEKLEEWVNGSRDLAAPAILDLDEVSDDLWPGLMLYHVREDTDEGRQFVDGWIDLFKTEGLSLEHLKEVKFQSDDDDY